MQILTVRTSLSEGIFCTMPMVSEMSVLPSHGVHRDECQDSGRGFTPLSHTRQ